MSPMLKGRGQTAATETETDHDGQEPVTELRSGRRLRAAVQHADPFVRAFADALRDILHDELRPTG